MKAASLRKHENQSKARFAIGVKAELLRERQHSDILTSALSVC